MADIITYELVGVKEVVEALEALNTKDTLSILRTAEKRILTKTIVQPLRAALPYSALTESAIRTVNDRKDKTAVWAGPTNKAFYLRFVDSGTKERKGRGRIIARNKIKPFILGQIDFVIKFINEEFGSEVEKILKRKLKKINK